VQLPAIRTRCAKTEISSCPLAEISAREANMKNQGVRNVKNLMVDGHAFAVFRVDASSGTIVVAKSALLSGRGLCDSCPSSEDELALRPPVSLMDMGFAVLCPLARHRRPPIRFLFIGSHLCSALLSGPASRRVLFHPCASLSLHVHHVVKRTYTS
jgi:hypothetical protein